MAEEESLMIQLPPGFRFHPTDEEIITHYLIHKFTNTSFTAAAISEADLNKSEPWDLPKKAKVGEKEWYFFCKRDRKYPTGMRTNRATESGYWKATGKDKEIYMKNNNSCLIGMKKTLVFYLGRAPRGDKTNWVMHEYRLDGNYNFPNTPNKVDWVVSRVIHKNTGMKKVAIAGGRGITMNTTKGEPLDYRSSSLPPLVAIDMHNSYSVCKPSSSSCFTDCKDQLQTSDNNNNYATNVNFDSEFPFQNPPNHFESDPIMNPSYLYEEEERQCKVEQFNQYHGIDDFSALWDLY